MTLKVENKRKLINFLKKIAPKIKAKVVVEPEWGVAAQIFYPNGVVRSVIGYLLDLNNTASTGISTDKAHTKFFLTRKGYPVAEGKTIFEDKWAKNMKSDRKIAYAIKYAEYLGYPVIIKPNNKSQGINVFLVRNKSELIWGLQEIFKEEKVALLERYLPGRDYRIVVLNGKILSAYERIPLSVVGDGQNSILVLLQKKQRSASFVRRGIEINFNDRRMKLKLQREGYTLESILKKGQEIFLLDNANLSSGGEAIDVMEEMHSGFREIAVKLSKDMGLSFCGVDIMVTKGDISENPKNKDCSYYIIETNASPGLITHYVKNFSQQKRLKEAMYLEILKTLGKKD